MRDAKHVLATLVSNQIVACPRKGLSTFVSIERIADADLEQRGNVERLVKRPANVAGLLCGDRRDEVGAEGRACNRLLDFAAKSRFEPLKITTVRHFNSSNVTSALAALAHTL